MDAVTVTYHKYQSDLLIFSFEMMFYLIENNMSDANINRLPLLFKMLWLNMKRRKQVHLNPGSGLKFPN